MDSNKLLIVPKKHYMPAIVIAVALSVMAIGTIIRNSQSINMVVLIAVFASLVVSVLLGFLLYVLQPKASVVIENEMLTYKKQTLQLNKLSYIGLIYNQAAMYRWRLQMTDLDNNSMKIPVGDIWQNESALIDVIKDSAMSSKAKVTKDAARLLHL